MPYAIRYNSAGDFHGLLVEVSFATLNNARAAQDAADAALENWYETHEEGDGSTRPADAPFPRYEAISAQRAHSWVKNGLTHETLLYTDSDGRIRRAR